MGHSNCSIIWLEVTVRTDYLTMRRHRELLSLHADLGKITLPETSLIIKGWFVHVRGCICILVTQACPDLCTYSPHTYIQPHLASHTGLPTCQEVKVPFLSVSLGSSYPFPHLFSLSGSLFTSLCRAHCVLIPLVSECHPASPRVLVLTWEAGGRGTGGWPGR